MSRWFGNGVVVLALVAVSACATGRAMDQGRQAFARGDWDAAVAYFREVVATNPKDVEARLNLERSMRAAAHEHAARGKKLEDQDQLPGAIAEYKLAADFDPAATFYYTKALQLERILRDRIDAARPPARIDVLRQQAAQQTPFPKLDPRTPLGFMRMPNAAVRDILRSIGELTGIAINYDRGADNQLTTAYSVDIQGEPIEFVLNQILTVHNMAFKVTGPQSIFIYQDTAQNRQKYDDLYEQTFYLEHADVADVQQLFTQHTQGGTGVRPVIVQLKSANALSVKATAPVLQAMQQILKANDKPRAEVMINVEIFEVDTNRLRNLGLDLTEFALGFTVSPGQVPSGANASAVFPPPNPPPINLGDLRSTGASLNDVYMSVPSAVIRLLETDSKSKLLARPTLRGREGGALSLNLGEDIPVPQTTFQTTTPGQLGSTPATSFQLRSVGVNLSMTPRVTYDGEVILDQLVVEKSSLGPPIDIAGQSLPTFQTRRAVSTIRLRDGESSMLAGLLQDENTDLARGLPWIAHVPILRNLFGHTITQAKTIDVVMIITPRIVRSHELTPEDFRARPAGTAQSPGVSSVPSLLPPGTPPPPALAPPGSGTPIAPGGAPVTPTTGGAQTQPPATTTAPPRAGVVPISPVGGAGQPPATPTQGQVTLQPAALEQTAGAVFIAPILAQNLLQAGTVSVTITYNPAVLRATNVTVGTAMNAGGVTPTFAPKIDAAAGRVDFAISRPTDRPGADITASTLLAAVNFQAVAAGSSSVTLSAVATTPTGQSIPVTASPVTITVK